jgi:hypothetical protein
MDNTEEKILDFTLETIPGFTQPIPDCTLETIPDFTQTIPDQSTGSSRQAHIRTPSSCLPTQRQHRAAIDTE